MPAPTTATSARALDSGGIPSRTRASPTEPLVAMASEPTGAGDRVGGALVPKGAGPDRGSAPPGGTLRRRSQTLRVELLVQNVKPCSETASMPTIPQGRIVN